MSTPKSRGDLGPSIVTEPEGISPELGRLPTVGVSELAVFCDFDGTFSVQDVGSTIAKQHLGPRRVELWERWEQGDLTAWQYSVELFEGFEFPETELEAFLRTVELDPGASDLVEWCNDRRVPFRVLSDGFDFNLDRLQEIHGISFEFTSNQLHYEGDRWHIAPGGLNSDCPCGTGTCKRGIIEAYRERHPKSFCVHVGNGCVSDLCGAMAADLAFAKETLAMAMRERGLAYFSFETLHDVVDGLSRASEPR